MATFTVRVDCNNDVFWPHPEHELVRILRAIADRVEIFGLSGFFETIRDANGNDVGRFAIKNEDGSNWSPSTLEDR